MSSSAMGLGAGASARSRSLYRMLCALVAAAVAAALLALGAAGPQTAAAAPGTPGTPQAPKVLFTENFEGAAKTGRAPSLNQYVSVSPVAPGATYTAADYWLTREACNGLLVSSGNAQQNADCFYDSTPAQAFTTLQQLAGQLGGLNGSGSSNSVVAAYTSGSGADNLVQFATTQQISLPAASGRFVTFRVTAAAANCKRDRPSANDPQLRFYFRGDDGTLTPVSTSAINPCTGAQLGSAGGFPTYGGVFPANGSLLAGSSIGIVMRNEQGSGTGNDGVFDDITVLDATPQLDKAFSPASIIAGGTSTLTFTITNTSDLAAKRGWSFADNLPANVTATGVNSTTCTAGVVTAAPNSGLITASGDLDAGQASCTISVGVTSSVVGTYTNTGCVNTDGSTAAGCNPNVTSTVGLDRPGAATLAVAPPSTTPSTSAPASTTPSTSAPASTTPAPSLSTSTPSLAATGRSVAPAIALGTVLSVLGVGAVLLARRRPTHH